MLVIDEGLSVGERGVMGFTPCAAGDSLYSRTLTSLICQELGL